MIDYQIQIGWTSQRYHVLLVFRQNQSITLYRNPCIMEGKHLTSLKQKKLSFSVIAGKRGKVMVSAMVSGSNGPGSSLLRPRYQGRHATPLLREALRDDPIALITAAREGDYLGSSPGQGHCLFLAKTPSPPSASLHPYVQLSTNKVVCSW